MSISSNSAGILSFPKEKATCIFRKLGAVKTQKSITQRLLHYVDEITKPSSQARRYKPQADTEAPLTPGEDFAGHVRSVSVRGFFIREIQMRTGKSPHLLDPECMLRLVDEIWRERIETDSERKPKSRSASKMHNGIVSISPEFGRLITESGRDVDKFLIERAANIIRKWQKYALEKYSKKAKGSKLSEGDVKFAYIVGVHHDRRHIHAHFCVYPYTEQGRYIPWSDDHRTNDNIYTKLRNFARKDAFAYFRDEMYAPAYFSLIGQDLRWQTHLITAKANADAEDPSVRHVTNAPDRLDEIGHMDSQEYQKTLGEAYDWAKARWEKLKRRKIKPEELKTVRTAMGDMELKARKKAEAVAQNRKTARLLAERKRALAHSLKRNGRMPAGIMGLNTLECTCDFWMVLMGIAFRGPGSDRRLESIFRSLAGRSPKYSLYSSILELFRGMYNRSDQQERRYLREIVRYSCKVRPGSAAEALLRKKVDAELADIDAQMDRCRELISGEIEEIRLIRCRHSELLLDLYLKKCVTKGQKPAIFRPEVETQMKKSRAEIPGRSEGIFACVRRMKASMKDASRTPDMLFDGIKKRITLDDARRIDPGNEAVK